ncbi:MAG: hypothetical protein IT430_12465 [Phycisphaerales bacterium]|nr:hypothetical protein [Phycisphaerales bacterium]
MPNWLQNNLATLIYVLAVLIPAVAQGLKVLAEKKREADAKRLRESAGQSHSAPGQPVMVSGAESTAGPSAASRQDQLAAQRQAQIEMWKAREAAMRRTNQPAESVRSAEDELARRRRVAMEELRRRQVEADRARASQSQSRSRQAPQQATSRRQQAAVELERRRQASQRSSRSARQQQAAPVVEQIVASLAPPRAAESIARRAPAQRGIGPAPLVLDAKSLRQAFIMKELLDPPVGLRDGTAGSSSGYHLPF